MKRTVRHLLWCLALTTFFVATPAVAAGLFLNPASGSFLVGSTFDLSIVLDTKGQSVNTVEIELLFPPDKLQVANPSVGQSIIQLWPAPPVFSNRQGRIYFVGGIPSPGIVTSQGVVLTLTFRIVAPGEATIRFGEATSVLANDGRGTDVVGTKTAAFFRLATPPPQGPKIFSPTHPDEEKWYADGNPVFVWEGSGRADGYSFSLDENPAGVPDTVVDTTDATTGFGDQASGFKYFHLRERAGGVWGGVSHYLVKIDREPPANFDVQVSPRLRTTNHEPIFRFFTTDTVSGLDYYAMKIIPLSADTSGDALFFEVNSPYQANNLPAGRYHVVVRATDEAGNSRDTSVMLTILGLTSDIVLPEGLSLASFLIPWWVIVLAGGVVGVLVGLLVWRLWHHHNHQLTIGAPPVTRYEIR